MNETPAIEKNAGRKGGFYALVNERLNHIRNAYDDLKKAPVLSLLIGSVAFVAIFLADQIVSLVYDAYKPDMLKSETEILSDNLLAKSAGIEARVNEITDLIQSIQAGDMKDAGVLQAKMNELLEGINGIRPDLSDVASLRRDLFLVAARQKAHDIDVSGMSPNSDVTLKMNDGATICKQRYTLAIGHSGDPRTRNPRVGLTSPTGENVIKSGMGTGQSLMIEDDLGRVSVSFMRHEERGGEALYGFNFTCPS